MVNFWPLVLISGLLLRIGFFLFGVYQDTYFTVKYTDIDYYVFNDAAKFVYYGDRSPYLRDTYRYTPLLSYILLPNFYFNNIHIGKFIFVLFDILTGILLYKLLAMTSKNTKSTEPKKKNSNNTDTNIQKNNSNSAALFSAIWLLNPMVITISTRGNAESVLCAIILLSFYLFAKKHYVLGGLFYGLSIHFKLYPIIYSITIVIYFATKYGIQLKNWKLATIIILKIGISTLVSLVGLTYWMYAKYGYEFLYHSYLYHFSRTDHRHNFSIWNMVLYLESSPSFINSKKIAWTQEINFNSSKLATIPQMLISSLFIPLMLLILGKKKQQFNTIEISDFINIVFLQTFAFVIFNKVITSQYFIWYLVYLPIFLFKCKSTKNFVKKVAAIAIVWILSQSVWLYFAYLLEFKNKNVFFPNLFVAHLIFFVGNSWILGQFIDMINLASNISIPVAIEKKQQ